MNKRHLLIAIFTTIAAAMVADDYNTIAIKADRFYQFQEWASASAMFEVMLAERPGETNTYARAIVAAGMCSDSVKQSSLISRAIDNQVSFDSLYSSVQKESFALGKAPLYEQFLLLVKNRQPWLARNIDAHLLSYYTLRRNPDKMIEMSQTMLQGLPDSIEFLSILAQGYMYRGDYDKAIDTYNQILAIDPDNYNALLEAGNYYLLQFEADPTDANAHSLAIRYLSTANAIRSTPYVTDALLRLSQSDR